MSRTWLVALGLIVVFGKVVAAQASDGANPVPAVLSDTSGESVSVAPPVVGGHNCTFLPAEESASRRFKLEAYWDNGLWFESADRNFRIHVGGNAQIDSTWLIGPNGAFAIPGGGENGVGNASAIFLRRVRLRADGQIYGRFDYIVEYDLANASNENDGLQPASFNNLTSSPVPCNVYMQIREVPGFGNIRIGNLVKPVGMTNNTSQASLPFIERADNQDGFYAPFDNGFGLGVVSRNWNESERLTWQYGVYGPSTNSFGVSLNKSSVGARVTGLPFCEDEGRQLLHLGMGYWAGELEQNSRRIRARPALRNGPGFATPNLVDTGTIDGSRQYTLSPELAIVSGPWTLQAEYTGQFLTQATPANSPNLGTVYCHGGYVQLLYFLTGEHQAYDKLDGAFGRVVPKNNYSPCPCGDFGKGGAWQVGARFSYLDLDDKAINGGQVYDWTLGLNWFLNPNMKLQLNYILERRDGPQGIGDGWINGIGLRAAYDF